MRMHTTLGKLSASERDVAPRYYYKRTRTYTLCQRITNAARKVFSFLFTQVGVCALVAGYMLGGAFLFAAIEAESQMQEAVLAAETRRRFAAALWNVTLHTNVIRRDEWRSSAEEMVTAFQSEVVLNVRRGYTGTDPGVPVWTFSSALMYSLTVFTTIGYGNLSPKTDAGKLVTMAYALVGIPLMLLYMTNIGHILGASFKYAYARMCRWTSPMSVLPTRASLPPALTTPDPSREVSSLTASSADLNVANVAGGSMVRSNSSKGIEVVRAGSAKSRKTNGSIRKRHERPSLIIWRSPDDDDVPPSSFTATPSLTPTPTPTSPCLPPVTFCVESDHAEDELHEENVAELAPVQVEIATEAIVDGSKTKTKKTSVMSYGRKSVRRGISALSRSRDGSKKEADDSNADDTDGGKSKKGKLVTAPKATTVEFKLVEDLRLVTVPVTACLVVLVSYILLGTVLFSNWEGWDYLDGAYFCVVSLLTIGFGDFVPGNSYIYRTVAPDSTEADEAKAKQIICSVYILLGMAIVAMCLNLMQEKIVSRVRTLARRAGLIRSSKY